jgi:hypothetical protein
MECSNGEGLREVEALRANNGALLRCLPPDNAFAP